MMRRLVLFILAFSLLVIGGCAARKPGFDQTYLPNSLPGMPIKKIDLTPAVANKMSVKKWGLFGHNTVSSVAWVAEDTLLFDVWNENPKKLLYSFRIVPTTGEIKLLDAEEKNALLNKKQQSASVADLETLAGSLAKTAKQLIAVLLSFGKHQGSFTDSYIGKLENNGFTLDIAFTAQKKGGGMFQSVYYDCNYVVTNKQTGNAFERTVRIGKEIEDGKIRKLERSLQEWLQSWRIAPDGYSYLITKTATVITTGVKEDKTLVESYPLAGLDINPGWDQIAILMIKENEETKRTDYCIEFYPFRYGNKKQ